MYEEYMRFNYSVAGRFTERSRWCSIELCVCMCVCACACAFASARMCVCDHRDKTSTNCFISKDVLMCLHIL